MNREVFVNGTEIVDYWGYLKSVIVSFHFSFQIVIFVFQLFALIGAESYIMILN